MKVKIESEVTQSCPSLRDTMDCSPPGSSIHGIFQARVLEWSAIAFSKDQYKTSNLYTPSKNNGDLKLNKNNYKYNSINREMIKYKYSNECNNSMLEPGRQ